MGKSTVEMPDIPDDWKNTSSDTKADVGQYYLPGLGKTYLAPDFADKVANFMQRAKDQGISLRFTQGYRDQAAQDALHNDPSAITPAHNSLHYAGRGVDIHWYGLGTAAQNKVVDAAKAAGLSWGGDYSKPDPVHFYSDPGTDRRALIDNFSRAIAASQGEIPDR